MDVWTVATRLKIHWCVRQAVTYVLFVLMTGCSAELTKTSSDQAGHKKAGSPVDWKLRVDERDQLDETVWRDEIDAQRHEQTIVNLWDNLRLAKDPFTVLEALSINSLTCGQFTVAPVRVDVDIERSQMSKPNLVLSGQEFREAIASLRQQGFQLVQSEWHHSQFMPRQNDIPAKSRVAFEIHATGPLDERRILRGMLSVAWRESLDSREDLRIDSVQTENVEMLSYGGANRFSHAMTYSREEGQYASSMPLIVHDLDKDGDSEIILSRWNRVYWNEAPGRFREGRFLKHFQPHSESAVVADFNGDSNVDFLTVGEGNRPILYLGDSAGGFPGQGVPCADVQLNEPSAITVGDIDRDGDLDVWLSQYKLAYRSGQMPTPYYDAKDGYPAFLLVNDGSGRFIDATESSGLAAKRRRRTYSSSFIDLDGDIDLDLMVVSDFSGLDIYENKGDGTFLDTSDRFAKNRHLFGMAHTHGDYNGDGQLDLFVVGMSSTTARRLDLLGLGRKDRPQIHKMRAAMTYGNRMYVTERGRFEEPPFSAQTARTGWSWGATTLDFDNDGDHDLYVGNGFRSGTSSKDYCTRYWCHDIYTGSSFPDSSVQQLLAASLKPLDQGQISWNGFEHNRLFMNLGGEFTDVGFLFGVSFEYDTRCVVGEDLDSDGRVDLLVCEYSYDGRGFILDLHVYRNKIANANHWIGVRLAEHPGGHSPLGACVRVKSARGTQASWIVTGDSFLSQHSTTAHFGIGSNTSVEWLEVAWPDGHISRLSQPAIDRYHPITSFQVSGG